MKELFEIYTKNKINDKTSFLKLKESCSHMKFCNWDQAARFVLQTEHGRNILVELDFPTNSEYSDGKVWLCAYEFDGNIENYIAEYEIMSEYYNGDFSDVYNDMKNFAINLI